MLAGTNVFKKILKIRWWNINGRWEHIDKNFMEIIDILFLCETHCNASSVAIKTGFKVYGDPGFPLFQRHGGLSVYVKNCYVPFINDIRFSKCTISFSISTIPKVFFMGVYVYPFDSYNHDISDYGIVVEEVKYWLDKGYIPFIGGDFNSRIGNINEVSVNSLKWRYNDNIDLNRNANYKNFSNMCGVLKVLPLNHCMYRNTQFEVDWTYFKGNKKSQIESRVANLI